MCRLPEKQDSLKNGLHGQTVFQAVWAEYWGRRAARCILANAKRVAALGMLVFGVLVFDILSLLSGLVRF